MNRVSHAYPTLDEFLGVPPKPLDALTFDRRILIAIVKRALSDLHLHRQRMKGHPGEKDAIADCVFWDEILGWLKDSNAEQVMLVRPAKS
ncbi:MAG TPA: hypothetical protein VEV39_05605 [Gemmatimonadales bacterium]|nr:hypothetical protein [Gemmatimonadales bacterium]